MIGLSFILTRQSHEDRDCKLIDLNNDFFSCTTLLIRDEEAEF